MIEQVNGKILPPFHERLQALVDEHGIESMQQAKGSLFFRSRIREIYLKHNRDLVIDFLIESLPKDPLTISRFLDEAKQPIRDKIWEDFEDHWYCGTNEEVVAAGSKHGDVDPLEPAKDLAEMRASDVAKEARG